MRLNFTVKNEYLIFSAQVLTILTILFLTKQILIPFIIRTAKLREEINKEQATVALLKQKVSLLSGIEQGTFQQDFENINQAVPHEKNIFSLLSTIDGAAFSSGISMETFSLKPGGISTDSAETRKEKSSNEFNFNLTAAGDINQIRNFITNLFKARRLVSLKKVSFRFKEAEKTKASIEGVTYYLPATSTTISDVQSDLPIFSAHEKKVLEEINGLMTFREASASTFISTPSSTTRNIFSL
jgi:Tfp pilus assembly protein PilO